MMTISEAISNMFNCIKPKGVKLKEWGLLKQILSYVLLGLSLWSLYGISATS